MPKFSSIAGLEVAGKFVGGWVGGVHVTTLSNSNASCFRVELRWVLTIALPSSLQTFALEVRS